MMYLSAYEVHTEVGREGGYCKTCLYGQRGGANNIANNFISTQLIHHGQLPHPQMHTKQFLLNNIIKFIIYTER